MYHSFSLTHSLQGLESTHSQSQETHTQAFLCFPTHPSFSMRRLARHSDGYGLGRISNNLGGKTKPTTTVAFPILYLNTQS